jgi:alkylation response protein AidB-like acyl-CoA dehydrogenase
MRQPGVSVRPLVTMTGAAEFAQVFFDEAVVKPDDVVGTIEDGWGVTLRTLESERGPYALRRAAVLGSGLARLIRSRPEEMSFHLRQRVTRAAITMHVLRVRAHEVARRLECGQELGSESALTKIALTEAEQTIFEVAHEMLGSGGHAWLDEPEDVELYLYSRAASIYGGSAQIQRNTLADRYLGMK